MDRMDRYLMQLPHRMPDDEFHHVCDPWTVLLVQDRLAGAEPDFHRRIIQHVWRRRRRLRRIRAGISAMLSAVGLWLVLPSTLGWLTSTPVPDSGLPWLYQLMDVLLLDFGARLSTSLEGFVTYQSRIAASTGNTVLLGLMALAFAVLLVMDQVMPRMEV